MKRNEVRIIGGKWRGRKISFPSIEGLRPTGDRTRETLFNWLAGPIIGANCLDLFAGSGTLGFESLSRGATEVTFVDQNREIIQQLQATAEKLKPENCQIVCDSADQFLQTCKKKFDIVFIDPPFYKNLVESTATLIDKVDILNPNAYLYIETEIQLSDLSIPKTWTILKSKQTKQVRYYLIRVNCNL